MSFATNFELHHVLIVGTKIQTDDPINFLQLETDKGGELGENVFETSLSQALIGGRLGGADAFGANKLNKVTQLTGVKHLVGKMIASDFFSFWLTRFI